MKKILFLLLLFSSLTHAADFWTDGWPIYIYGDVQSVEMIFNAIAMIISSDTYQTAIEIVVFLGILVGIYGFIGSGQFSQLFYGAAFIVVMIGIMTATPMLSKVHIIDKRVDYGVYSYGADPNYAVVDNVPIFISLPASFGSLLSYGLTNIVDTTTSAIDPDLQASSFNRMGYGENINLLYDILPAVEFQQAGDNVITGATTPCETINRYGLCLDSYVRQCGLDIAAAYDNSKLFNIQNPSYGVDLVTSISPANLGLMPTDSMMYDGVPYSCSEFYDIIKDNSVIMSKALSTKIENIQKENNIDLSSAASQELLEKTLGLKDDSSPDVSYMAGASKMEDFMYTLASSKVIANAMVKSGMGSEYTTSDYTGDILNYKALAKSSVEGSVMWSFMSNILPMMIHFILLVASAVGIFVFLFAFLYGWAKGTMLIATYMMNIIVLSMTIPALAFVHNLVNFFVAKGGVESMMANGRPGSLATIPHLSDYMTTMSGVAGFLGLVTVIMIPGLIATGKVSGLISGAVSAIGGMRANTGKDARAAAQEATTNRAMTETRSGETTAVTKGQLKEQVNKLGWSQLTSSNAASDAGQYAGAKQAGMDLGTAQFGNRSDALKSGQIGGAHMVGADTGGATHGNVNTAHQAGIIGGAQQAGQMSGLASSMSANQGYNTSMSDSSWKARQQIADMKAKKEAGTLNYDNTVSEQGNKAMSNTSRKQAHEFAGVGDYDVTKDDLKQARTKSGTEFEAGFAEARGFNKSVTDAGKERYMSAVQDSSMMKTSQMIGGTEGAMSKFQEEATRAGKKIADVMEDTARTLEAAKTGSSISGINSVGSDAYIRNAERKAAGDQLGLNSTIATADEKYGSYEKLQADNAKIMTDQRAGLTENLNKLMQTPEGQAKINSYVNNAHQLAKDAGRGEEFIRSLQDAKLMDKDGNIQHENWAYAKSYLQANNMNSHNALVAGGMTFSGALGENSSVKADGQTSLQHGKTEKYSNDSTHIDNTNPQTRAALAATDTIQEAGAVTAGYDAAKFGMDPKNSVALAAGIAGQKVAGDDADVVAAVAGAGGGIIAGGAGLKALDRATADNTKYLQGEDGQPLLDDNGKKMENPNYKKGVVSKGWGGAKEGIRQVGEKLSPFSSGEKESLDEADSSSNNQSNNKNNSHPNNNIHGNSFNNSSTTSLANKTNLDNSGIEWTTQSDMKANGIDLSGHTKAPFSHGGMSNDSPSSGKKGLLKELGMGLAAFAGLSVTSANANDNGIAENVLNIATAMDPSSYIMGQTLGDGTFNSPEFLKSNAGAQANDIGRYLNGNGVADFSNHYAVQQYAQQTGNQELLSSYNGFLQSQMQNPNFNPETQSIVGKMNGDEVAFGVVNTADYMDYSAYTAQVDMQRNGNFGNIAPRPMDPGNPLAQYAQQTSLPPQQDDPLTTSANNEGMLTKQDTDQYIMSVNSKASQAVSGVNKINKEIKLNNEHLEEKLDEIQKEKRRR